jgi:TRAP-type C4-dicarboxylate transport system permease large subunit
MHEPRSQAFVVFSVGMLVLMGIGMNMGLALVLTGAGMAWVLDFWDTQLLAQNLVAGVDSFPLLAVPFFILAGELMNAGGISRRIIDMAQAWVGHIRGGLGYVAIGAAVLMASMSGSALADTAALATILLPMMRQQGYPMATSAGLMASGGIIAPIIPPSMPFVIYGVTTNTSISALFVSGIVPGLHHGRRPDRHLALRAAQDRPARWPAAADARAPARHGQGLLGAADAHHHHRRHEVRRVHAHRGRGGGRLLCAGGGPVHAPRDEAARDLWCAGAGGQDHVHRDVPVRRRAGGQLHDHPGRSAQRADRWLGPLVDNPRLLMAVMMVALVLIGTALDLTPTILIFAPVMLPIAVKAGIDPVYFGLMFVLNGAIGLITPPVGTVLNVVAGVGRMSMHSVIKGVNPFLFTYIVILALFVAFPQIVTAPVAWMR